jgi:hypothetical protein
MRWILPLVFAAVGCAQEPEQESAPTTAKSPGAPIVALLPNADGRLADGRVFDFSSGFDDRLLGATTADSNGPIMFGDRATCLARADGILRCFGSAEGGLLAGAEAKDTCHHPLMGSLSETRPYPCANEPAVVPDVPRVQQISHSCALSTDGGVFCWGGIDAKTKPRVISGLDRDIVRIATSYDENWICGIGKDGRALCADRRVEPVAARSVSDPVQVVDIALGIRSGCFLGSDGVARCFDETQAKTDPWTATRLETDLRFTKMSITWEAGGCAITVAGQVACFGRLVTGVDDTVPRLLSAIDHAIDLVVTGEIYVLRDDGSVVRAFPDYTDPRPKIVAP